MVQGQRKLIPALQHRKELVGEEVIAPVVVVVAAGAAVEAVEKFRDNLWRITCQILMN
jgi:hypothetical protein